MINQSQKQLDRKKGQSKETEKVINDEMEKLVKPGIVRLSLFLTCVANLVFVKKEDGKWRM